MLVYSAEHNYCIYESAFYSLSLHTTKKGAYKAMRKHLLKEWEDRTIKQPYHNATKEEVYKTDDVLFGQRWRVATEEVLED